MRLVLQVIMNIYLNYPFDINNILKKKKAIKRELLQQNNFINKKIAILGGSTTSEIKNILELFLLKEGIKPEFYESEYGKYYEESMFGTPELKDFAPDIVYIHTTNINITEYPKLSDSKEDVQEKLKNEITKFKLIWEKIKSTYNAVIIQNNFELPYYRVLGNLDFSDIRGKTNFIMQLNAAFAEYAQIHDRCYINDINYLSSLFGLERWADQTYWLTYKYALSCEAIPLLCHNIAKIIKSIYGKRRKCLVVDLDNTLWGGIIGDDGVNNIQIGKETTVGEAYSRFQQYIKELKDAGVILAVCSKNDPNIAREGFLKHPDSILKLEDFAVFIANWNPKPQNITEIADVLNIGLDSLVFIDDDPVEREMVKSQLSMVEVPNLIDTVATFIDYIDREGYFEPVKILKEDLEKTKYYKDNIKREKLQGSFENYDDFLKSLNMKAEIEAFKPVYLDRITQITNKTNQFNFTTERYTLANIEAIAINPQYITLYGRLIDKFGDNGVISTIIGNIKKDELHIDLWLMSCRVFNRGMEYAMFDDLVDKCKRRGIKKIIGYYYKTAKNEIVSQKYGELGFKAILKEDNGNSIWEFDIPKDYERKNRFIQIIS